MCVLTEGRKIYSIDNFNKIQSIPHLSLPIMKLESVECINWTVWGFLVQL